MPSRRLNVGDSLAKVRDALRAPEQGLDQQHRLPLALSDNYDEFLVSATFWSAMAGGLHRHPQLESVLRARAPELALSLGSGRSIGQELAQSIQPTCSGLQ